jgi:hypothetical protein
MLTDLFSRTHLAEAVVESVAHLKIKGAGMLCEHDEYRWSNIKGDGGIKL